MHISLEPRLRITGSPLFVAQVDGEPQSPPLSYQDALTVVRALQSRPTRSELWDATRGSIRVGGKEIRYDPGI